MTTAMLRKPDYTPQGEELDRTYLDGLVKILQENNNVGPCHWQTLLTSYDYQKKGIPYRMCHGTYRGQLHKWVEYQDKDGAWLVDDEAQGIKGWTRDACKHYVLTSTTVPDWRKAPTPTV